MNTNHFEYMLDYYFQDELSFNENEFEEQETTTNSSLSEEHVLTPERVPSQRVYTKRKLLDYKIRRRVCQFPRIFKRDFRRQFPLMYLNVLNSCDYLLHEKFLQQFFSENCDYKFKYNHSESIILTSKGREYLHQNCLLNILKYPDITFQLHSASIIRTLLSDHYKVEISMTTKASQVFHSMEDQKHIRDIIASLKGQAKMNYGYKFESFEPIEYRANLTLSIDGNGHVYELNVH